MIKKMPGLIVLLAVYFLFRGNMIVGIVGLVVCVLAGLYLLGRSEEKMEKYPERKGTCLGQIGVGEFFLGNYEKALEKYIGAKDCGEDNDKTEYNIWEVCETIYNQKGTKESIEKYIDLYPQGRYIIKAKKLVL